MIYKGKELRKTYKGKETKAYREFRRDRKAIRTIVAVGILAAFQSVMAMVNTSEIEIEEPPERELEIIEIVEEFEENYTIEEVADSQPLTVNVDNEYEIMLREKALEYGLSQSEIELVVAIVRCESNFNPNAKNSTSTATGLFQFLNKTWIWVNQVRGQDWTLDDRYDAEKNIDNGLWLFKNYGATHWECYNCGLL